MDCNTKAKFVCERLGGFDFIPEPVEEPLDVPVEVSETYEETEKVDFPWTIFIIICAATFLILIICCCIYRY
jgi:hypothetical protein